MGNDTMAGLASFAVDSIPPGLVSQLGTKKEQDTPAPQPARAASPTKSASSLNEASSDSGSLTGSKIFSPVSQVSAVTTRPQSPQNMGETKIDYEVESKPPADFASLAAQANTSRVAKAEPEVVLLTGVSGLLGHHLLKDLLEKPQIKKVICVAVRQISERLSTKQLTQHAKVLYFEGDLRSERLGLFDEDAAAIFDDIDVVIHNGADTSHLKYYPAIKGANVNSTRWLTCMCLPRQIPIHYVSSVGVSLFLPGRTSFPPVSATDASPPADGSHGYIASKWTNEKFLESVSELYGLKVWIHRPSTIIREGADTVGQVAQMDWVNALIAYSHRLKTVPKCKHARGALDFVTVQTTVGDIVGHVLGERPRGPGNVAYAHQVADLVLPLEDMKSLAGAGKAPYREVAMEDWTAKAIAAGLHPAVAALIETMDAPETYYPRMLKA
ncbi:hypothetical protein SUNI508_01363 [Seiridium unicorne]|uniref:Thioester reductase (TE) domain-containing protein n=1 Tax=Seiridium unicorne TaxID=138068 RepID=A0ABR2UT81_9PEZI